MFSVPTSTTNEPQILLSWFEDVKYRTDFRYDFRFIYFAPANSDLHPYFLLPNGQRLRLFQTVDGISALSEDNKGYLREISLSLLTTQQHGGTYTLVIEDHRENNSINTVTRKINLIPLNYTNSIVERSSTGEFRVSLTTNRIYKLTFYSDQFSFLDDNSGIMNAEIEAFGQLHPDRDCDYRPLPVHGLRDCGIFGLARKTAKYNLLGPWFSYVLVMLNVSRSCNFRLRQWNEASPERIVTSYLNITALDERFSIDRSSDQETGRIVVESVPDGQTGGSRRLINESITLRCMVPICDWELIGWCQPETTRKCAWLFRKADGIVSEGLVGDDASINVSINRPNNYTISFDMKIASLAERHSGQYACGVYFPLHTPRKLVPNVQRLISNPEFRFRLPFVTYRLQVLKPQAPVFTDGNQNGTQDNAIEDNGVLDIFCPITGTPEPVIVWKIYETVDNLRMPEIIDSAENKTSLRANRTGIFQCEAKNAFGINGRKFYVRLATGTSMIPIAVALPLAAAMISCMVGLTVWLRRRATTVSIVLTLAPTLLCVFLLFHQLENFRLYSKSWHLCCKNIRKLSQWTEKFRSMNKRIYYHIIPITKSTAAYSSRQKF